MNIFCFIKCAYTCYPLVWDFSETMQTIAWHELSHKDHFPLQCSKYTIETYAQPNLNPLFVLEPVMESGWPLKLQKDKQRWGKGWVILNIVMKLEAVRTTEVEDTNLACFLWLSHCIEGIVNITSKFETMKHNIKLITKECRNHNG